MIHTGYTGKGMANYEWYEYCLPPDPTQSGKVKAAQEATWHACNAAAVKYNSGIAAKEETPEWVHKVAAQKGLKDLAEIEEKTGKSWNPTMTALQEQAFADQAGADTDSLAKTSMTQKLIVGGSGGGPAGAFGFHPQEVRHGRSARGANKQGHV